MNVNWFGLAGGALTITVVVLSLFVPWWHITVGEDLAAVNTSPFATKVNLLDVTFTPPLIGALNLMAALGFVASGIVMLIYAVLPNKNYSLHLLGFSYKKPLIGVITFVAVLFLTTAILASIIQLDVPLSGSTVSTLPVEMTQGINVSVMILADFEWPLLLAILAAGLCIAAKLYHKKLIKT